MKARKSKRASNPSSKLVDFCRRLPHATEDIKWKKDLVFSVAGKMFACFHVDDLDRVGFKTTPGEFAKLVRVDGVIPAPYAARFHWVNVTRKGVLTTKQIESRISDSYQLVASCLPKKSRKQLGLFDDA